MVMPQSADLRSSTRLSCRGRRAAAHGARLAALPVSPRRTARRPSARAYNVSGVPATNRWQMVRVAELWQRARPTAISSIRWKRDARLAGGTTVRRQIRHRRNASRSSGLRTALARRRRNPSQKHGVLSRQPSALYHSRFCGKSATGGLQFILFPNENAPKCEVNFSFWLTGSETQRSSATLSGTSGRQNGKGTSRRRRRMQEIVSQAGVVHAALKQRLILVAGYVLVEIFAAALGVTHLAQYAAVRGLVMPSMAK